MSVRPVHFDFLSAARLLTRQQAAAYCGVGTTTLTTWIERGIIPGPVPGTHRWDKKAIDLVLDILGRLDDKLEGNALDRWRATRRARQT
jgi:excisionase family DNA binding protein